MKDEEKSVGVGDERGEGKRRRKKIRKEEKERRE